MLSVRAPETISKAYYIGQLDKEKGRKWMSIYYYLPYRKPWTSNMASKNDSCQE